MMRNDGFLTLETAPAGAVLTVAEVKAHLRIDGNDEDAYIGDLIETATDSIDGRDGWLGRCLITQQWKLTIPSPSGRIYLRLPPVQAVNAVSYTDRGGDVHDVDAAAYRFVADPHRPYIEAVKGWPSSAEWMEVIYTAGYGAAADVKPIIKQYLLLFIGDLYQNRETAVTGTIITRVPSFINMLEGLRVR